ncbi:MAG TPA: helix-turn-helix domain-containing protein [Capillimicrobium sp.]|nr:helix-turn-helix domain-containing protein [Capillimicrobium sp.]
MAMPLGLRERKKLRTRETIARVALDLFDRQGFRATTIAEIAEAADVAPRTVSAYFPAKEDLVFADQDEICDALAARLDQRRPGETAIDALRNWIVENLPAWEAREPELRTRRRVIESDDGLRNYGRRFHLRAQEIVATAIARDLGGSPDDLEVRMAAAATAAVLDVLGELRDRFHEESAATGDVSSRRDEAIALVDRALVFVGAGVRALRER